jgi:hypothetical protein
MTASSKQGALRAFESASDSAEYHVVQARDAAHRASQAGSSDQRREAVADLVESMMDASYELGRSAAYLEQAGRKDPFSVPRYTQVAELFHETLVGARQHRVANLTDRGRAAFAAGITSVAGAILGGVVGGPIGALAGSVAGGALGPYAFMREMREPEEIGDAVVGGGAGGVFSPVGAAVGAYLAGGDLETERRKNPDLLALKRSLMEI